MPTLNYNPTPIHTGDYISQIYMPAYGSNPAHTYYIKDAEARQWIIDAISAGIDFILAWDGNSEPNAAKIPAGVTVTYEGTTTTGTLLASATTKAKIYLVYSDRTVSRDVYEEYVTVDISSTSTPNYAWEALGNTDISLDILGELAWKDTVTLNKGDSKVALTPATIWQSSSSSVSFSGTETDNFVKGIGANTSKLETTTIKGISNTNAVFNAVSSNTSVKASYTTFSETGASLIETEEKTVHDYSYGVEKTASRATAGTAFSVAVAADSPTYVATIGSPQASSGTVLSSATVDTNNEMLIIGKTSFSQGAITGTNGTATITPYTFTNVQVPNITPNGTVTVNGVKTNTPVVVPVVTENTEIDASLITTSEITAAKPAASAITVATGSLKATDAVGATVATGVQVTSSADAITNLGTATAAAQTVGIRTAGTVSVAEYDNLSITVANK